MAGLKNSASDTSRAPQIFPRVATVTFFCPRSTCPRLQFKLLIAVVIISLFATSCNSKTQNKANQGKIESNEQSQNNSDEDSTMPQKHDVTDYEEVMGDYGVTGDALVDESLADMEYYSEDYDYFDDGESNEDSQNQVNYDRPVPIINNGIEKGFVFKRNDEVVFINEAYCKYKEGALRLNDYSVVDAAKFPEDIPPSTYVAYTNGKVDYIDTIKDEYGNKVEVMLIRVESTDSYGRVSENHFVTYRYESDIAEKTNYSDVLVTGMFAGVNVYDDNNDPVPVFVIHDIYPRKALTPAIRDYRKEKIYELGEVTVSAHNFDLSYLTQTDTFDEKYCYTARYPDYDAELDRVIVGLYNSETKQFDRFVYDTDNYVSLPREDIKNVMDKAREKVDN